MKSSDNYADRFSCYFLLGSHELPPACRRSKSLRCRAHAGTMTLILRFLNNPQLRPLRPEQLTLFGILPLSEGKKRASQIVPNSIPASFINMLLFCCLFPHLVEGRCPDECYSSGRRGCRSAPFIENTSFY